MPLAFSATVHCLTGCAIGEVLGMVIGTALGFSDLATIALAVVLAFFFGYTLTSLPLLRSGMELAAVVPIALASNTISITIMEIVDNAIILTLPGAMDATLGDTGFWAALAFALLVAGVAAYPANRWLLARGKGHAVVHPPAPRGARRGLSPAPCDLTPHHLVPPRAPPTTRDVTNNPRVARTVRHTSALRVAVVRARGDFGEAPRVGSGG
jgi:hypothetical protein